MKKKVLIGVSSVFVIAIFITTLVLTLESDNDNVVYQTESEEKQEYQVGGFLTLMLETEAGSGVYEKSASSTWPGEGYVFNENLSSCENGGELSWNEELGAVNLKTNNTEKCYVYFDKEPDIVYLADYIINNVYVEDGVNGLYYHDGQGTYTNADQEAGDNSYRYAGANPNNYICFGSTVTPCPDDNMYQIIGIFDNQAKLIKKEFASEDILGIDGDYDSIGNPSIGVVDEDTTYHDRYYWNNTTDTTIWSESSLNTINLNTNYINTFETEWVDKIAQTTWQVEGKFRYVIPVNEIFNLEIVESDSSYNAKIGLMYVSDYGYAVDPNYWTTELYSYSSATSANWMYMGLNEWTISPYDSNCSYRILSGHAYWGYVYYSRDFQNSSYVRPVFYLNSDVEYASGDGSIDNPFRIVV